MQVIARSEKFLYINKNGFLVSVQVTMSADDLANTFYSLPKYKNEDEVKAAFPDLR